MSAWCLTKTAGRQTFLFFRIGCTHSIRVIPLSIHIYKQQVWTLVARCASDNKILNHRRSWTLGWKGELPSSDSMWHHDETGSGSAMVDLLSKTRNKTRESQWLKKNLLILLQSCGNCLRISNGGPPFKDQKQSKGIPVVKKNPAYTVTELWKLPQDQQWWTSFQRPETKQGNPSG